MRKLVHSTLQNEARLTGIVGSRVYSASSLGQGNIPAVPDKPFIIYRFADSIPYRDVQETSSVSQQALQVYAHQHRGSYLVIDRMLAIVRETLLGLEGQVDPDGIQLTGIRYVGTSTDLDDTVYDSNMRFSTFYLTAQLMPTA